MKTPYGIWDEVIFSLIRYLSQNNLNTSKIDLMIRFRCDHILFFNSRYLAIMNGLSLLDHILVIRDPRQAWKIEHTLTDIIFLTIAAVIAGAEGWEDIEDFGEDNLELLRQYGDFKQGIPVHDTIARVINIISAKQLQRCFTAWMKDCHEVIAIDGKTLRGHIQQRQALWCNPYG